jgi:hypothetical protein
MRRSPACLCILFKRDVEWDRHQHHGAVAVAAGKYPAHIQRIIVLAACAGRHRMSDAK